MRSRTKKIGIILAVLAIAMLLCMGIVYLFDVVLNGTFIEWFDSHYITHLEYSNPEAGITEDIPYMSRSSVKKLLMQLLIFGVILFILLAFVVAHFYGRHVRTTIARNKQLLSLIHISEPTRLL